MIQNLSWEDFKIRIQAFSKNNIQYDFGNNRYRIFIQIYDTIYQVFISSEDPENLDLIDFETNYKNYCNKKVTITSGGGFYGEAVPYWKGFSMNCPAYQISYTDVYFESPVLLFGGDYKVVGNANRDDFIEVQLVILVGEVETIVGRIGETIPTYFFPNYQFKRADVWEFLPPEIFVRVYYKNYGANSVELGFILEAWGNN